MLTMLWNWWYGVKPKDTRRIIFLPTQQERFPKILPPGRHTLTPDKLIEWYYQQPLTEDVNKKVEIQENK